MPKTNTATLLPELFPEQKQLGSLEIARDRISSWRNSIASVSVNNSLDNEVAAKESIVPTAPIITTEPIISAESVVATEPITSAESVIPTSDSDLGLNGVLPAEKDPSVASYDAIAPMETVTLGAQDLFPQSKIATNLQWRNAHIDFAVPIDSTYFEHRIDPALGYRGGQYELAVEYTATKISPGQPPVLRTTIVGEINPVGALYNKAVVDYAYNTIAIKSGTGNTTGPSGNPVQITILPFEIDIPLNPPV